MIQEILIRKQTPQDGMWLTRFDEQSNTYNDTKCAWLGKEDTEWEECSEKEHQEHMAHNEKVHEEQKKATEVQQ